MFVNSEDSEEALLLFLFRVCKVASGGRLLPYGNVVRINA